MTRTLIEFCCFAAAIFLMVGCAVTPPEKKQPSTAREYKPGTIVDTRTGQPVSFETLVDRLSRTRIIYLGEQHTNAAHHRVQLDIIRALYRKNPRIIIGMEMFDNTYQAILDQWSAGRLDSGDFLEKVHWYANWRYDFALYRDTMDFIRARQLRLIGLNLPAHIPPKIRVGGIDNLSADEKNHLPASIDTSNQAHRAFLKKIFEQHHKRVKYKFEYFYAAQCVWEDTMAEAIANNIQDRSMIVLAGSGHIINKFGIPERAFRRTNMPYLTVYPVPADQDFELSAADYIWVTDAMESFHPRK